MSIDVMTKVMQRCPLAGSQRLALLVMANWCDDDGESLYPSIELVAEAMQVSRSQAKRVLRSLMPVGDEADEWWLRVVGNKDGGAPGSTRRYQLNVARLDALPKLPAFENSDQRRRIKAETTGRTGAPPSAETGRTGAPRKAGDGAHGCTRRGAPVRPDSSVNLKNTRESAREEMEHEFEQARRAWPSGFADSRAEALAAWHALSDEDRTEAAAEIDRFVRTNKSVGRKVICGFAAYLREQRWKALPDKPQRTAALTASVIATAVKRPTAFQRAHPDLYPELFTSPPAMDADVTPTPGAKL